jgi:uncharacterized membrane protein
VRRYIAAMHDPVKFRLRGREVSRVEAFSDVVFGFALTLIVVSLEVPTRYEELVNTMRGFPAFAICFAILTWVWHAHHTYFRRYALSDEITIALNTALLFLVLFYIYPMKFIFSLVTGQIAEGGRGSSTDLFLIYGLGFAGIFTVFVALYTHAWRQREELDLTSLERHDTVTSILMYSSYIGIGLLSCTLAVFAPASIGLAGWTYFLIGPASALIGMKRGAERRRMEEGVVG